MINKKIIINFSYSARDRFQGDAARLKTVQSPWPPFRLPPPADEGFEDPRKLLHSKFCHGLIFNLLYKAVHGEKAVNDFITSLAVHLLELSVTFPQQEGGLSGKEVAVSKPWLMVNEPIDLEYDTWFPTDCLSANLRQVVSVIFSEPPGNTGNGAGASAPAGGAAGEAAGASGGAGASSSGGGEVAQSMEVDQVSDVSDAEETSYQVETPSSITMEEGGAGGGGGAPNFQQGAASSTSGTAGASGGATAAPGTGYSLQYQQPLALTGPSYQGSTAVVPSQTNPPPPQPSTSRQPSQQPQSNQPRALTTHTITDVVRINAAREPQTHIPMGQRTLRFPYYPGITTPDGRRLATLAQSPSSSSSSSTSATVTIVNESMISLLLKLHSKYSNRFDSYVPLDQRSGATVSREYRESRIGDACFFVEKLLDRICETDEQCRASVEGWRKQLWPHYHKDEAKKDEEQEKREAEEKKKKARERQRKLMEQMAAQRRRFMESNDIRNPPQPSTSDSPSAQSASSSAEDAAAAAKEAGGSAEEAESSSSSEKRRRSVRKTEDFTCCHCLATAPASEDRPIGLVALIQSTSVLAHRHHKTGHLALPTSEEGEESLRQAFESSLGTELNDR